MIILETLKMIPQKKIKQEKRKARMERIKQILGNRCYIQGCYRTPLTIDHKYGRDYSLSNVDRVVVYEQELIQGRLRLLCSFHNSQQGAIKKQNGFRNKNHHVTNKKCFCSTCWPRHLTKRRGPEFLRDRKSLST